MTGKTCLVTGATSGLGRATAVALARRGAVVVLGCRDPSGAGERARAGIVAEAGCSPDVVHVGPAALDLDSNASVKTFAAAMGRRYKRLDLLVNNAGTNYLPKAFSEEGVGRIAQVNFLGPAMLTRLLEKPLLAAAAAGGVANVVHVSSVTHRYAAIPSVPSFLTSWEAGSYSATKLANVLFAYECQRRWGSRGVRSCAVDPGAVHSNLWNNDAFFGWPPVNAFLSAVYAPPRDGAVAVVTACLEPFARTAARGGAKTSHAAAASAATSVATDERAPEDAGSLTFYARGLFASAFVAKCAPDRTRGGASTGGVAGVLRECAWQAHLAAWGVGTLACSMLDWPARRCSGGRIAGGVFEVPSSPASYDPRTAGELWDEAGKAAGL